MFRFTIRDVLWSIDVAARFDGGAIMRGWDGKRLGLVRNFIPERWTLAPVSSPVVNKDSDDDDERQNACRCAD